MKEIEPIAFFRSPLTSKFGVPRQSGLAPRLRGRIVFEPKYRNADALRGLEDFDYVWLIWGFSHAVRHKGGANEPDSFVPTVRPPRLGGNQHVGVFASRSPFRPNGLGLSSVRIVGIEGTDIVVAGADLMDGTPIYDVKPYLREADSHADARSGFTDTHPWHTLRVDLPASLSQKLTAQEASALIDVLAQDPRPQYQQDESRVYGMAYSHYNVRFRVSGGTLYVVSIESE